MPPPSAAVPFAAWATSPLPGSPTEGRQSPLRFDKELLGGNLGFATIVAYLRFDNQKRHP